MSKAADEFFGGLDWGGLNDQVNVTRHMLREEESVLILQPTRPGKPAKDTFSVRIDKVTDSGQVLLTITCLPPVPDEHNPYRNGKVK